MATDQDQTGAVLGGEDAADIEVVIVDGEGAEGTEGAASGGGGDGGAEPPKGGESEVDYADLRRQLEEERAGKLEATRRAEAAVREVQGAQVAAIDGQIGHVTASIGEWRAHTDKLKRELVEAQTAGDFAKAADLTEKVGEAGAVMRQLNDNKTYLERVKKNPPQPQRQAAPAAAANADPVEAFAANRPAKTQAWVRANPEFIRDPKKFQKLQGAHVMALADHEEGSDGYFEAVNTTLGIKPGAAASASPRRPAPVAAPVSRDAPGLGRDAARPRSVTLTASEVSMAKAMGVDLKTYAREKAQVAQEVAAGQHRQ